MLSPVDEIKNKLDIIELISGYIKLQKAGRNWRANCPFHSEKTPSFMVSAERQIWHCFGCGKGGDIFSFVKEIEGLDFTGALRLLAQRTGVTLKKQDPKIKSEKEKLYELCELSAKFFSKQLAASGAGAKINKYLQARGINNESISQWRLGFAPGDWRALSDFLKSRGYKDQEIIASGVVVEKEIGAENKDQRQKYYDRFRNRIIFPIFDINGQIVGFAGRVAPGEKEDTAKYINTPQTMIYDKSRLLYGLNWAKTEIRKQDFVVLVEGNTDVIMAQQHGFLNTVASSGTALTADHLKIIKRFTNNLILAFDMDAAGDMATKRAIDLTIESGFNVKIIPFAKEKKEKIDPADILKSDPKKWGKIINSATGIIEFYFSSVLAKYDPTEVGGKKEIARIILPLLKKIPDAIERNHWIQKLSERIKTSEKILTDAIKNIVLPKEFKKNQVAEFSNSAKKIKNRLANLEEEIIGLLITAPDEKIIKEINSANIEFINPQLKEIFNELGGYLIKNPAGDEADFKKWKSKLLPELNLLIEQILFKLEIQRSDIDNFNNHLHNCIKEFKKEKTRYQMVALKIEINECEKNENKEKLAKHLKKFNQLASRMNE